MGLRQDSHGSSAYDRLVKSNKKWMETHRSPSNLTPVLNFLSDRWVSPTRSARPVAHRHIPRHVQKVKYSGGVKLGCWSSAGRFCWIGTLALPTHPAFPAEHSITFLSTKFWPWGKRGSVQVRGEGIRVSIFMSMWGALGGRIIHRYI